MDERDVLLKAASLVEEGWCQCRFFYTTVDGQTVARCLTGALLEAFSALQDRRSLIDFGDRLYRLARRRVKRVVKDELMVWNDAPGRTQAEVVDALRRAALSP